jgi:hypothetical protein
MNQDANDIIESEVGIDFGPSDDDINLLNDNSNDNNKKF